MPAGALFSSQAGCAEYHKLTGSLVAALQADGGHAKAAMAEGLRALLFVAWQQTVGESWVE